MTRLIASLLLLPALTLGSCDGNCTATWTCINGDCTCDANDVDCANPASADSDDQDNCEILCPCVD